MILGERGMGLGSGGAKPIIHSKPWTGNLEGESEAPPHHPVAAPCIPALQPVFMHDHPRATHVQSCRPSRCPFPPPVARADRAISGGRPAGRLAHAVAF